MNPIEAGYITVADRLAAFNSDYPGGVILTKLESLVYDPASQHGVVVVSAQVWRQRPDAGVLAAPDGTGLSSMPIPGLTNFTKGSEAENAETSAVGRALAMIGYLAKDPDGKPRISSEEEIISKNTSTDKDEPMSTRQQGLMFQLAKEAGIQTHTAEGKKLLSSIVLDVSGKHSSKQLVNSDMDNIYAALRQLAQVKEAAGGEIVG